MNSDNRVSATMRILVTGSSGFVGSHIVAALEAAGIWTVGLDLSPPLATVQPSEFFECDVAETARLRELIKATSPDAVVHAAAITPGAHENALAYDIVAVNQLSTLTVLLTAAEVGSKRVVFLSSAGVYLDPDPGEVLTESSAVANEGGLYAQTKLASERLCAWSQRELGLSTTALRVGPVYGEYERPTGSRQRMSPISQALSLIRAGSRIRLTGRQTVHNWIHGADVARAVQAALGAECVKPIYNVAGAALTMSATMETLRANVPGCDFAWADATKSANLIISDISRPVSSELIRADLGFEPVIDLETGLARVLAADGC